jgi:metallo-beta-lactamase class B
MILPLGLAAALPLLWAVFLNGGLAGAIARDRQQTATPGADPSWNVPHEPFRIHGRSFFVGTHGLSAILIAGDDGHVLIDAGLPESVPQIIAHVRALGFRVEDIKAIVTSHVHFDHSGGVAELQRLSGARVFASPWSAAVLTSGTVPPDDPLFGAIVPIARVADVSVLKDGEAVRVGSTEVTARFTPGHTPGSTSWTWQSCEPGPCRNLVYADSLTAVSADDFKFTTGPYRTAVTDFERTFKTVARLPCDILLTPHPGASDMWGRLERNGLLDPAACRRYADAARAPLQKRLAQERTGR